MFKLLAISLLSIIALIGIVFGIGYLKAEYISGPGLAIENAKTEQIHVSNQYRTTYVGRLQELETEYSSPNSSAEHRKAIINQMWDIKGTLPDDAITSDLHTFFAIHPKGSN